MNGASYVRYELLRNFRNIRFVVASLAYPLVVFFAVAVPNRRGTFDGITFPLYFMTGMAAVGAMIAVVSAGARVAADRAAGWTRQLRITPLSTGTYFSAKVLCGYLMALLVIGVMCLSGTTLGVRLSAGQWLTTAGLLLVGLVPLVALGIGLGHLLTSDSLMPAVGGITVVLAILGGAYGFQVATSGPMFAVIRALPSYWLVQAGKTALGGTGWPAQAWLVIAAWTVVLVPLAVLAYRRDTSRI